MSKIPNAKQANGCAFQTVGYREENPYTIELVRVADDIPGYALRGDFIWVVRFGLSCGTVQEAWVSSTTAQVRCAIPFVTTPLGGAQPPPASRKKWRERAEAEFLDPNSKHELDDSPDLAPTEKDPFVVEKLPRLGSDHLAIQRGQRALQRYNTKAQVSAFRKDLAASLVPTPKAAVTRAREAIAKTATANRAAHVLVVGLCLMDDHWESMKLSTLYQGDPTWLVRFMTESNDIVQQAWVNAITGKVNWIFPNEPERNPTAPTK